MSKYGISRKMFIFFKIENKLKFLNRIGEKNPFGDDLILWKKSLVFVSKKAEKAHVYLETDSDLR